MASRIWFKCLGKNEKTNNENRKFSSFPFHKGNIMKKQTKKILDSILWILGIIAITLLIWGIIKILFNGGWTANMDRKFAELYYINLFKFECSKYYMFRYITNLNSSVWINGFNINSFKKFNRRKKWLTEIKFYC